MNLNLFTEFNIFKNATIGKNEIFKIQQILNFETIGYLHDIVTTLNTIFKSLRINSQSKNELFRYIYYKVVPMQNHSNKTNYF